MLKPAQDAVSVFTEQCKQGPISVLTQRAAGLSAWLKIKTIQQPLQKHAKKEQNL